MRRIVRVVVSALLCGILLACARCQPTPAVVTAPETAPVLVHVVSACPYRLEVFIIRAGAQPFHVGNARPLGTLNVMARASDLPPFVNVRMLVACAGDVQVSPVMQAYPGGEMEWDFRGAAVPFMRVASR